MNASRVMLALALASLGSCKGSGSRDEPRLPFHVALAPVVASADLKWQHDDDAPPPDDWKFQLEMPEEAVKALEQALQAELGARSFVLVTALAPDGERGEARTTANVGRALASHADLLLQCHLRFHPAVVYEVDGTFVLNLPVWFFLGPISWLVDDCDYVASVELTAEFYDLGELEGRPGDALGAPTRLLTVTPGFDSADLDFVDRNGGAVYKYLPSIVVPPGFLFRGSERTREQLRAEIVEVLVADLADAVRQRGEDLVEERQRPRGAFWLDPGSVAVRDLGGTRHALHCELVLRPSASVEELHQLSVEDGSGAVLRQVALVEIAPTDEVGGLRYAVDLELELPPGSRRLVLAVTDQDRRQRSFTVEIPPGGSGGSASGSSAGDGGDR